METIKKSTDINLVYRKGKKFNFPFLKLVVFKDSNHYISGEVAFIAGKKNGNAVWRNKSKRKLREIYKNLKNFEDFKLLLIANKDLNDYKNWEIIKVLNNKLDNEIIF